MYDVAPPPERRSLALLPARVRAMRRPKWWQEILFVLICYWLYTLVRNAVPSHQVAARHRALSLLSFEHSLHIDIERSVNAVVAGTSWLAYACDYYYATLHFVVTIAVLVWLYVKHPLRYRSIRSVLFATNVIALIGFWVFALAPPRMFPSRGFVDTVVAFHTWGSYASGDVAKASNQFAAMPSLHIGWSLWCAIAIVALAERTWVRALGVMYPLATLFVVIGTGNHYVLDVVGGVVALSLGFVVQRLLSGRPAFARPTVATLHPSEFVTAH
ncbi:MAG TPA: phosphatase PAP2 family protein [Mycobacteriales bacterium]|nr:phosphatase PAP2 family protein [Mycobacteriales bacterium]